jgi:glycosyltransferase involved in cell wall biosynthesis
MAKFFSIIVPTHNRAASLDRCLLAMGELDWPGDEFEVLVVDDGSNPPPAKVLARHAGKLPLRSFRTEGVGPASARNLALAQATGEYVVFTDDDCRPSPEWLRAYAEAAGRKPGAGFGGSIVDAAENNIYGRTSQMLISYLYEHNERTDELRFFCSNNLAFPRQALLAMGGFDESFPLAAAEDRYVCTRWLREHELAFVPGAAVEHRQMLGLRSYLRQQFRYGRGACQFWKRREIEDGAVNRVQPASFYTRMLAYPFGKVSFGRALAMSALLICSQVAGFLGYLKEQSRSRSSGRDSPGTSTQQPASKAMR